jgi:hypothetical protein
VRKLPFPKVNSLHHHARDIRPVKEQWPCATTVEKTFHGQKSSSRGELLRENSMCRETAVKPPCKKDRLIQGVIVRQAASMESCHERRCMCGGEILLECGGASCQPAAG